MSTDVLMPQMGESIAEGTITKADIAADFYAIDQFTREPDDITLFKNGGGAHLDLMTARHVLNLWRAAR